MLLTFVIVVALFGSVVRGSYVCQPGTINVDLSNQYLGAFPNLTACATSLRTLTLTSTNLASIPSSVSDLVALEELKVDGNQLQSLPDSIGTMWNLRLLWARDNALTMLPESFSNLINLEQLHLHLNDFWSVPPSLFNLPNLWELRMENNHLTALPAGLSGATRMQYAYFTDNQIHSVPAELGSWTQLQVLYLWNNPVTCLPRSLTKIPSFYAGNYLPTCKNNTVAGYMMQRTRNHDTCGGPVRNISGEAFGCIDYVQSTCTEVDGAVLVTKRYLSDLDSRGLGCEPDAPVVHEYTNEYPRCAGHTGTATSCADLHGLDGPYPHKFPGLATITFSGFDQCNQDYANKDFGGRRLVNSDSTDSVEASIAAADAVKPRDHYRLRPELPAYKASMIAKQKMEQTAAQRDFARQVSTQSQSMCNISTTVLHLMDTGAFDFSACPSLRELYLYEGTNMSVFAEQVPHLVNLRVLSLSQTAGPIPDNLDQLHNLRNLSLIWLGLPTLPEVVRRLPGLTSLTYWEQIGTFQFVPHWLSELTQLESLDFSTMFLYSWPAQVLKLTNLRRLAMTSAAISSVPASVSRLVNLRSLDLRYNHITVIPESVADIPHLTELHVSGLTCLPKRVADKHPHVRDIYTGEPYPVCPEVPLPLSFSQVRNAACLWDPYYEFWYRAVCDGDADRLEVTLYADSACKKKAKRKAVHGLRAQIPGLGYCMPQMGFNTSAAATSYTIQYCHN